MRIEDILTIVGIILGIVIPFFVKLDDKADKILSSILLAKIALLEEFIDKIENKIRNNLVYDDNMNNSFASFIKQMNVSYDNKKGIEKYVKKCSKYTAKLIGSAISIFIFTGVKHILIVCNKYELLKVKEMWPDALTCLIILNFFYLMFCSFQIWRAYMGFRSLSSDIKKQADLII